MPVKRYNGTAWEVIAGDGVVGAQGPAGTNGTNGIDAGATLISTTTLSGASVVLSSIPSSYKNLRVVIRNNRPVTDGDNLQMRFNGDSGSNRYFTANWNTTNGTYTFNSNALSVTNDIDNGASSGRIIIDIPDYTNSTTWKTAVCNSLTPDVATPTSFVLNNKVFNYNQTAAISSITLYGELGNFTSGTVLLYGVN